MAKLLDARTTDGSSSWQNVRGGMLTVFVYGTFDGATVKIELSPDQTEIFEDSELTFTEKGMINFAVSAGVAYRATVSDADSSTSVTVWAF